MTEPLFISAVESTDGRALNGVAQRLESSPMEWDDVMAWVNAQLDILTDVRYAGTRMAPTDD